ncbi:DUF6470 family protein [Alkalihalobacillus sp. LMS39]|uniref:DUF6470 family protein n=1 Tax=Alkalihalobacillus sp. LMS39 TaxID=2924032 RepID=UPI001FB2A2D8|nr:DUF6470 family protein [Alkalihalobacillus sp. LMS39]UOE93806.1 DUF6470 family protein [Alkalihalobacillus sp. LMS39]
MQLPYLDITTTDAKIGMKSNTPPIRISQRDADVTMRGNGVDHIKISTTASQLFIDQSAAFADAGLKGPLRRADEHAQKTTSKIYEFMAKKMQQGDAMMKIENGSNVIPRLAVEDGKLFDFNLQYKQMPTGTEKVRFNYSPSKVSIEGPQNRLDINVNIHKPQYQVSKWQTDVYVQQKESIHFSVVGLNVNRGL